jgi:tyrosyl-tRNA synthetase
MRIMYRSMTLSEELQWRGFVQQTTLRDLRLLDDRKWVFYHGFDASADSQAIGNLAAMMLDKAFMRHGHSAILLAGGATSLIGDPGGKDKERVLQDDETISRNVKKAQLQLAQIFRGHEFLMVNNLDWTRDMSVLDFLRDIGKHFSMTSLVQRDYIAQRIGEGGSGISYTEFSYTLLQGMDYLHLYDKYGVTLQLGGSDQWGNCLSGVDLVRRVRGAETHVITLPLVIDKSTGRKFGKSEEGTIWLDPTKTSVYRFYQFWLNIDDSGVEDYLKIYTELDKQEIDRIMIEFRKRPSGRLAQQRLADEVTKIVHGSERAAAVRRVTEVLFGAAAYDDLTADDYKMLQQELPVAEATGDFIADLMAVKLAGSRSEARRLILDGAVAVQGRRLSAGDGYPNRNTVVVKRGKNKFAILVNK